jgi:hypothetical protein
MLQISRGHSGVGSKTNLNRHNIENKALTRIASREPQSGIAIKLAGWKTLNGEADV